jgi:hypothetical protein
MLRREDYIKQISDDLAWLQKSLEFKISAGLLDANIIAEDFVKDLLNVIFDFRLENLNFVTRDQPGIDLGDAVNGISIQVTSTKTRKRIQDAIDTLVLCKIRWFLWVSAK